MSRRKSIACAVALATAAAGLSAGPAGAAATPKNATLTAVGGPVFEPNRMVGDGQRFNKDVVRMRSGGTLTLRNRTGEPHTFSVVKRSDVPRSLDQLEACFAPDGACGQLAALHGITEETQDQPPPITLVNQGPEGFNQFGDSIFFIQRERIKITASKGKKLSYLCLIHPWMQGRVSVR